MRAGLAAWAAAALVAAPAAAQAPLPAKPQTASLDSEAPPGAPPHWLPSEQWVMQHWLPYDETRLYELLQITRGDLWRWLRDDTRNLADLARSRGRDPEALARALVAPWRGKLREPARLALLESRALRTLTQGHLAQHVFFHSLHQNAIPDNAPAIFGTASREQFQQLRRAELSPVQICRINGLSGDHARERAEATLRRYAARAVDGQAMPAAQGRRLLARQLRQLPRWLHQTRYNGPPPLKSPRASAATASNYSNNGVIAADGASLAFESYDAKLATAKQRGEISVLGRRLAGLLPAQVSLPRSGARRAPRSAYNPSVSADGRFVAFEAAEGNLNFAKRYGQMDVFVRDLHRGDTLRASTPEVVGDASRSAYNPSISGDGRRVAFESSESGRGLLDVFVTDLGSGRSRAIRIAGAGRLGEPDMSGDGRFLALTSAPPDGPTRVLLHDLARGTTVPAGAGAGDAYEPDVSADGRAVAYTAIEDGRSKVYLWERGRRTLIAPRAGDAFASEPALAANGRAVAFTLRTAAGSSVWVHDLVTGVTELVSRASGPFGPAAMGESGHPSISGDGRLVSFTSDAWNLADSKCNAARGIFVRDRGSQRTRHVSAGDGDNRYTGPTKGSSDAAAMTIALVCA